jgi:hypothetical protein
VGPGDTAVTWNRELGTFVLFDIDFVKFKVSGTTPRNADMWCVDIVVGKWLFGASVEYRLRYATLDLWIGDEVHGWTLGKHRKHKKYPSIYSYSCSCQNR